MGASLQTFSNLFAQAEAVPEGTSYWGWFAYVGFTLLLLFGAIAYAKRGFKERVFKNPLAQAAEQMYLFIESMCVNTIGAHGRKYIPIIGTFWLVIFVANTVSLFFASAPTAELSFNLGMALIAVGYVQYEGINLHYHALRQKGRDPVTSIVFGFFLHLRHFAGPKLHWLMAIIITPMIFLIEIVSELMKNVSLSLRLFGNIHGGHEAVEAMNQLGHSAYIPVGGFLLLIKLLTVVVQALIFTLLTCVYLSLVTHHDHEEGHDAHDGHAEAPVLTPAH